MSEILDKTTEEITDINIQEEINFVETDAEVISENLLNNFEFYLGETLARGDERRIILQAIAYMLVDQINHINETGRSNLLRYAIDDKLDGIGTDIFLNKRLAAKKATVTLKFALSNTPTTALTIPKGTRVTPDGEIFFATDSDIIFNPNTVELSQEVSATATVAGSDHNDYEAGSINILVDTSPYVASVENTTVSGGGSDAETDEEYRERLRESPFSFSVAGPANAYRAIAMAVSGDISDVAVYSPSAGVVEIAVVKDGGEIPTEDDEILTLIYDACTPKDVRPLTDMVQVVPAVGVSANINVTYYVANNNTSAKSAIENAVDEYIAWQVGKLGRHIDPDELNVRMREAGAARAVITEPAYKSLEENEIAQIGTVTINYGGSIKI